jgi:hypothetical protein
MFHTIFLISEFRDGNFSGSAFLAKDFATLSAVRAACEESEFFWAPVPRINTGGESEREEKGKNKPNKKHTRCTFGRHHLAAREDGFGRWGEWGRLAVLVERHSTKIVVLISLRIKGNYMATVLI